MNQMKPLEFVSNVWNQVVEELDGAFGICIKCPEPSR